MILLWSFGICLAADRSQVFFDYTRSHNGWIVIFPFSLWGFAEFWHWRLIVKQRQKWIYFLYWLVNTLLLGVSCVIGFVSLASGLSFS
ncbi:MAG: hypothetical protein AAFY78_12150 [Cyanobacteria bacterium J06648_16]